jgi:hypothetical protein
MHLCGSRQNPFKLDNKSQASVDHIAPICNVHNHRILCIVFGERRMLGIEASGTTESPLSCSLGSGLQWKGSVFQLITARFKSCLFSSLCSLGQVT